MQNLLNDTGDTAKELKNLLESGDEIGIVTHIEGISPSELARAVTRLDDGDRTRFLELLGPARAAFVLSKLSGMGAASIIEQIDLDQAAPIVGEMTSHDQADLLREVSSHRAEQILKEVESTADSDTRALMNYPENTAGALMITEYLSYNGKQTVRDVLDDMLHAQEAFGIDIIWIDVLVQVEQSPG